MAYAVRSGTQNLALIRGGRIRFTAMRAEYPHQPLRDHSDDVAGHDVGLNTDVEQAGKRTERRVRVQGRKNLMTGHGRTKCHLGSIAIADFADENDVRVLAHH